jgi:hypothetical protein
MSAGLEHASLVTLREFKNMATSGVAVVDKTDFKIILTRQGILTEGEGSVQLTALY